MADNSYTTSLPPSLQSPPIDVESIVRQIARLPLAIPEIAEKQLATLLEVIVGSEIPVDELFFLLEYIRSPLSFVREAAVRYYCTQAPMLDKEADAHFQQGIGTWQRMVEGYSKCLKLEAASRPLLESPHRATILHRCLYYQGLVIFEHYRAKRRLPGGVWRDFHSYFATAEKLGSTRHSVTDELFEEVRVTDCQAAYIAPLLLSAAKPFGHSGQQLEIINRWTVQWAHLATIASASPARDFCGFVVDLDQDAPHLFEASFVPGDNVRLLDTTSLVGHLRRILELLDRRPPPESFGLTEDNITWTRPLLGELEKAWAASHDSRRAPRLLNRSALRLSVGFDQIHTVIAASQHPKTLESFESLQLTERSGEDWFLVEESKTGCRLVHPAPRLHLQIHQLVSLCGRTGDVTRLGQVQWLMQDGLRGIVAGIALLPGQPSAVSIRGDQAKATVLGRFISRAFVLSNYDRTESITIVLPKNAFKLHQVISIPGSPNKQVELQDIIQSGTDFDHVLIRQLA